MPYVLKPYERSELSKSGAVVANTTLSLGEKLYRVTKAASQRQNRLPVTEIGNFEWLIELDRQCNSLKISDVYHWVSKKIKLAH